MAGREDRRAVEDHFVSFDWDGHVCACGHWAADHIIPADEEQPASAGACNQTGCACPGMRYAEDGSDEADELDYQQDDAR